MADELTPQEQEEFEFRHRAEQEQPQAAAAQPTNIPGTSVDYSAPGFVAGTAGVVGGAMLGPGLKSEFDKYGIPGLKPQATTAPQVPPTFKSPTDVAAQAIKNRQGSVTVEGYPSNPNANYGRSQFVNPEGKGLFYGTGETGDYSGVRKSAEEAIAAEKQFPGMKSIQGGATPFSVPEHVAKELESLKIQEDAARNAHNQAEVSRIAHLRASRLQAVENAYKELNAKPGFMESVRGAPVQAARRGIENVGDFLNRTISPHGMATAGSRALGALGGLDVGLQGTNAVEHAMKGQYGRAAVSGLGALGGAAALTRHPLLMPIGMGIAAGAPYLNEYLDTLAEKHPGLHLADGGSVEDQNQGAYVGYPQINRSRQVGSGSGFLDAALGAPQQNPSVLDPKNASYLKGYEAGEPYGIAGNVLPFLGGPTKSVGKAALRELGPKGADIMEQYLTKIGGIAHMMPTDTKIMRASEALSPHEGKYLNLTQSDRMRSTGGDLGGPGFSKFQLENPDYAGAAWGVAGKPTASGIVNVNKRYPEGRALWTPMIGSETQHHSNQHVYDALTQEFNRQASMGNLPKELQARINARMTNAPATKGMFPEGFDIGNPEHLAQYGDTFNRRGEVSKVLSGEGVGGTKGRVIDYPGIMQEMTDPMTIGAPTHSIGTRLFNLTGEVEHRPDLHSAFPYILKGEDKGVAFSPVPKELGIPDFINQFKEFKGREPGYYDLTRTTPSQQITDKYLKGLESAGHKKGGKIKKAKKK
jgi:hypothetical protein